MTLVSASYVIRNNVKHSNALGCECQSSAKSQTETKIKNLNKTRKLFNQEALKQRLYKISLCQAWCFVEPMPIIRLLEKSVDCDWYVIFIGPPSVVYFSTRACT